MKFNGKSQNMPFNDIWTPTNGNKRPQSEGNG